MGQCLRLDGDWYGLVRAMYSDDQDHSAWGEEIAVRLDALVPHLIVGLQITEYTSDARTQAIDIFVTSEIIRSRRAQVSDLARQMDRESLRRFYFPPRTIVRLPSMVRALSAPLRGEFERMLRSFGVADGFGIAAHPVPGVAVALYALTRHAVGMSAPERALLARIALHLESSIRLRRRPESVVAVLRAGGGLEHLRDPNANTAPHLGAEAALREARRRGRGADALALWKGLLNGELSVVERGEGRGSKTYFYENPPHRQPMRSLTFGEQDVLSMLCLGHSAKAVAYGLGVSEAAVSMRLERAAGKVGLASRMELVRLAAMLTRDPRARFTETTLTTAERDVLELLAQGLSNGEIARARGRSVRTIANQVSALLTKTGASNRKALVALGELGPGSRSTSRSPDGDG